VVGWVDLRSPQLEQRLAHYAKFERLKGFRHILQAETPEFMLQHSFLNGIGLLKKYHFTYDILIFPQHLPAAVQLVKQFPDQPFVIDHIAKPYIKDGMIDGWKKDMAAIAQYPNVLCKISGMVTEAAMRQWKTTDFTPYLDVVTECFGVERLMYGSDWPVCLCAGSYQQVLGIVKNYFAGFSADEQQSVFAQNAAAFYQLT
jgi:L-fuconolactonase